MCIYWILRQVNWCGCLGQWIRFKFYMDVVLIPLRCYNRWKNVNIVVMRARVGTPIMQHGRHTLFHPERRSALKLNPWMLLVVVNQSGSILYCYLPFLKIMTLAKYIFSFGHFCLCDQASTERIGLNSITIEYILASSEILLMGCWPKKGPLLLFGLHLVEITKFTDSTLFDILCIWLLISGGYSRHFC